MAGINLIMPMAGRGSRFLELGYNVPKPLIEIHGKPFFYWSTISIFSKVKVEKLIFVVLKEHCEKYGIDNKIKKFFPLAEVITIANVLNGALLTGLEGLKKINNNDGILFNDCDHMFRSTQFYKFINNLNYTIDNDIDGAIMTFRSNSPQYSYVKLNKEGRIIETVEKVVVSDSAICGAYYFKNKEIVEKYLHNYISSCIYDEYFFSGLYNVLIADNRNIIKFDTDFHLSFGTPSEYIEAKKSKYFNLMD